MQQQASSHKMNGEGIIDRVCAHTFYRWPASFCTLAPWLLVKFFLQRDSTSTIFIQFVSFIDRKCSLDSELSEFEGIIVIGDIYWILERCATYPSYLCNVFLQAIWPAYRVQPCCRRNLKTPLLEVCLSNSMEERLMCVKHTAFIENSSGKPWSSKNSIDVIYKSIRQVIEVVVEQARHMSHKTVTHVTKKK